MAQPKRYNMADTPRAFRELLASFERALRALNRSALTISTYRTALVQMAQWLTFHGNKQVDVTAITRADLEAYMADLLATRAPATAHNHFAILHVWFAWLSDEEEIARNPMARMRRPELPEKLPPVPTPAAIRATLAACAGKSYEQRRDLAIIRLLLDTGMRRKEIAGLTLTDIDFERNIVTVGAKGTPGSIRLCPFGHKTALALDRYLRARRMRRHAAESALWLGQRGPMSGSSIYYVVRRRAEAVGVTNLHPHLFRHAFAHLWLKSGGQERDLLELAGWRSSDMLRRYGASLAGERAREAHKALSPGDRF